jgi:hypothetical protein
MLAPTETERDRPGRKADEMASSTANVETGTQLVFTSPIDIRSPPEVV